MNICVCTALVVHEDSSGASFPRILKWCCCINIANWHREGRDDNESFDSTIFRLPLPDKHRFPMAKYSRLAARIRTELPEIELLEAPRAHRHQLARVHCPNYIQKVFDGTLTKAAVRRIGFPWSDALVERSRRSVGATIAVAMCARG